MAWTGPRKARPRSDKIPIPTLTAKRDNTGSMETSPNGVGGHARDAVGRYPKTAMA